MVLMMLLSPATATATATPTDLLVLDVQLKYDDDVLRRLRILSLFFINDDDDDRYFCCSRKCLVKEMLSVLLLLLVVVVSSPSSFTSTLSVVDRRMTLGTFSEDALSLLIEDDANITVRGDLLLYMYRNSIIMRLVYSIEIFYM